METVPSWWIWASGLFFILGCLSSLVTIVVMLGIAMKVWPLLQTIREKVDTIGDQSKQILTTVQSTASLVQQRTHAIVGTAESRSQDVTRRVGAISAGLTGLFTAVRLFKFVRKMM